MHWQLEYCSAFARRLAVATKRSNVLLVALPARLEAAAVVVVDPVVAHTAHTAVVTPCRTDRAEASAPRFAREI